MNYWMSIISKGFLCSRKRDWSLLRNSGTAFGRWRQSRWPISRLMRHGTLFWWMYRLINSICCWNFVKNMSFIFWAIPMRYIGGGLASMPFLIGASGWKIILKKYISHLKWGWWSRCGDIRDGACWCQYRPERDFFYRWFRSKLSGGTEIRYFYLYTAGWWRLEFYF